MCLKAAERVDLKCFHHKSSGNYVMQWKCSQINFNLYGQITFSKVCKDSHFYQLIMRVPLPPVSQALHVISVF